MKKRPTTRKQPDAQSQPKFNPFSTTAEAQNLKLADLLRLRPHHTEELRKLGLYHPPARVRDLRRKGFAIETARITLTDRDGFTHRGIGLYSLAAEPEVLV